MCVWCVCVFMCVACLLCRRKSGSGAFNENAMDWFCGCTLPWRGMPSSMSTSCNCSGRAPAAKVRGTHQMPDVLQKRGPRPCGRQGVGHGGLPQCERKRLAVSGGSSPNSLPSLPKKRVLRGMLHCGAQGRPDTVANWPDPSKCWQEQPKKVALSGVEILRCSPGRLGSELMNRCRPERQDSGVRPRAKPLHEVWKKQQTFDDARVLRGPNMDGEGLSPLTTTWAKTHSGEHNQVRRVDPNAEALVWCRRCSVPSGGQLVNRCSPTKKYGKDAETNPQTGRRRGSRQKRSRIGS